MRMHRNCRFWDRPRYGMIREQRGSGRGYGMGAGRGNGIGVRLYEERDAETRPCYGRYAYAQQRDHVEEAIRFHEERLEELKSRLSSIPAEDE